MSQPNGNGNLGFLRNNNNNNNNNNSMNGWNGKKDGKLGSLLGGGGGGGGGGTKGGKAALLNKATGGAKGKVALLRFIHKLKKAQKNGGIVPAILENLEDGDASEKIEELLKQVENGEIGDGKFAELLQELEDGDGAPEIEAFLDGLKNGDGQLAALLLQGIEDGTIDEDAVAALDELLGDTSVVDILHDLEESESGTKFATLVEDVEGSNGKLASLLNKVENGDFDGTKVMELLDELKDGDFDESILALIDQLTNGDYDEAKVQAVLDELKNGDGKAQDFIQNAPSGENKEAPGPIEKHSVSVIVHKVDEKQEEPHHEVPNDNAPITLPDDDDAGADDGDDFWAEPSFTPEESTGEMPQKKKAFHGHVAVLALIVALVLMRCFFRRTCSSRNYNRVVTV